MSRSQSGGRDGRPRMSCTCRLGAVFLAFVPAALLLVIFTVTSHHAGSGARFRNFLGQQQRQQPSDAASDAESAASTITHLQRQRSMRQRLPNAAVSDQQVEVSQAAGKQQQQQEQQAFVAGSPGAAVGVLRSGALSKPRLFLFVGILSCKGYR